MIKTSLALRYSGNLLADAAFSMTAVRLEEASLDFFYVRDVLTEEQLEIRNNICNTFLSELEKNRTV